MTAKKNTHSVKTKKEQTPRLAPGMDQLLNTGANKTKKGEEQVTRVTRLFLDEFDPS
jgi:hypothetical protein